MQQTLFFPLLARARETGSKRPLLSDPKAVELARAIDFDPATFKSPMRFMVLIRTMILDWWVRQFLTDYPHGTVVELGTGLNTRFERTDNGLVHWIDLDLPDTIELRRRFFADTDRRRMLAASLIDEDWLSEVEELPGPYFFVSAIRSPRVLARQIPVPSPARQPVPGPWPDPELVPVSTRRVTANSSRRGKLRCPVTWPGSLVTTRV